jgi:methylated-DNA-[protein]-cysteine S-methyltransferase
VKGREREEREMDTMQKELKRMASGFDERSAELAAALDQVARRRGLLDVAYSLADSPFGKLLVAVTPNGVIEIEYPNHDFDRALEDLAARVSPRVLESPRATERVRRQLEEYFAGNRRSFTVEVDLSLVHGFTRKVLEQTARIPFGAVSTYREVATGAGSPLAVRAAGNALGSNPIPIVVPCHRVLRTGGGLGGYTGGIERKVKLLELEGVSLA